MNRDQHIVGLPPDWSHKAQRFNPLTHSQPHRRLPQAVHRTVPQWRVTQLRVRWFVIGCIASWLPLVLVRAAVRIFGGAA